ncbi:neprilysin-1 [Dermacentor silvarum]|uniref:neprilysin-1 n=1 Tax=Dermacentor silvarum TaxID=543639 RepID=UPI002101681A|nr:neprilysin-1 [Dermacentor silvarum]
MTLRWSQFPYIEGLNIEGLNMEGLNMEGLNMEGLNMEGLNMEGLNMEGLNMEGLNMEGLIIVLILVDKLALQAYPWCDHPTKCSDYAEDLAASLDRSVDPCDNLYGHVCAHYAQRYPAFESHFHLLEARSTSFLLHELDRSAPEHPSAAVRRVVSGYQACVLAFKEHREDVQVLFDVLSKFNVTWPVSKVSNNFDIMEYLLGLSLDYGLPTPLQLSLEPYLKTDRRYGLSLSFDVANVADVYKPAAVAACMPSLVPSVGRDSVPAFGKPIYAVYLNLMTSINALFRDTGSGRIYTTIEQLNIALKGHVDHDGLLNAINKHLPQDIQLDKNEELLVYNNTATILGEVLSQSGYADIVLFSGWNMIVLNQFGLSSSLLYCLAGRPLWKASIIATKYCLVAVNQVAGYALSRFFVDSLEQSKAVLDTTDTWNTLQEATRRNFATLKWMDQSTAQGAMGHVSNLISIIPIPAHLNSSQALDAFYDYLVADQSQSFFQWFINTQKQRSDKYKRLLHENQSVTVYREDIQLSSISVNAMYLPLNHLMIILAPIMSTPFVPAGVPPAVTYGSMGKILGHELSHAFDPRFSTQSRTGDPVSWWSQPSYANFLERVQCLRDQLANFTGSTVHSENALSEAFADTAGTEKARLAYASLPKQQGILGYSHEQLFFIAGCFEFCSKDPYYWRPTSTYPSEVLRCNLPASNNKDFAAAFQCPTGASLNPPIRCPFH